MPFSQEVENLIASFLNLPPNRSRAVLHPPASLDQLMESVIEKYHLEAPRIEQVLMDHWKALLGEKRAHRCKPQKILKGGILVIHVANSTLRQELHFEHSQLLKNIQKLPGCEHIQKIRLR